MSTMKLTVSAIALSSSIYNLDDPNSFCHSSEKG